MLQFLSPQGDLFQLIAKLEGEGFLYEFPVSCLPVSGTCRAHVHTCTCVSTCIYTSHVTHVYISCSIMYYIYSIHIHTCTCTPSLTYTHTLTHTHARTHIHTHTHTHIHTHTHTHMHTHTHAHIHTHTHTHTHSHTHTHTHTHIHTHTHTHTHTQRPSQQTLAEGIVPPFYANKVLLSLSVDNAPTHIFLSILAENKEMESLLNINVPRKKSMYFNIRLYIN